MLQVATCCNMLHRVCGVLWRVVLCCIHDVQRWDLCPPSSAPRRSSSVPHAAPRMARASPRPPRPQTSSCLCAAYGTSAQCVRPNAKPTMLWLGQAALSAGYAKSLTSEVVHDVPDERPLCERAGLPPVRSLLRHEVEHKQPVRRDQREVVGDVLFGPRFVQKLPALQCVPSSAVQGRPVQSRAVQCAALLIDRMHCCAMHTCTTQTAAGSAARSDSYCVMPAVLRYAVSLDAGSCSSGDAAVRQGGACSAARKSAADHCACVRLDAPFR